MDERTPLEISDTNHYYGKNDNRPLSCGQRVCLGIVLIILSPLVLAIVLLWTLLAVCIFSCMTLSPGQVAGGKVKTFDWWWFKAPGKRLEVKSIGGGTSDIIISPDFVREGTLHTCGGSGFSLRKSIECSVDAHIREGPHGAKVAEDTDVSKPRYHLHGRILPYDPNIGDELWTNSARFCHWPSIYCWCAHMRPGLGWSGWTEEVALESAPDVFGYIVLFEVTNPNFFDGDSRNVRVGQAAVNCPPITPENEGKLFVRYDYQDAYWFGNIPRDEPDAYIFKGKTLEEAQMKVLHTYRLMKPAA